MSQKPHNSGVETPTRAAREAAALRENLRKRKAQQAARAEPGNTEKTGT